MQRLSPRQWFLVSLAVAIAVFLLWAALVPLDVIVRAEGRIIPAGKSQIVQHLEGGIVRRLLVSEGERITAGQPLIELSDIQARSNLGQEKSRLLALRAREARLVAESTGSTTLLFPDDLDDEPIRATELAAWQARRHRVSEEVRVLREQSAQKRAEINEARARRTNLQAEMTVAQQQFRVIEGLKKNGAASDLELLENQSRVQRLSSQISEAEASIPRLQAAASEIDSRINEVWARFRAEAYSELAEVRSDLEKSTLEITTGEDRLDRNIVRAPASGFVNRLNVTTVGGVVRPGEALMEITPQEKGVVIEARARPNDRGHLRTGLPARIRLLAYDHASYGFLTGHVSEVSADILKDEREGFYYRVRLEAGLDAQLSKKQPAVPGMMVTADIVVGQRTLLSYLLSPVLKFQRNVFRDPL